MTRNELIDKLKINFNIKELVCRHCYNKFNDKSWLFISTELLNTLYVLRYVIFKKPITVNNWHKEGPLSQRGLRCNQCDLVKNKKDIYLSAHCLGKAVDFNVRGLSATEVYEIIKKNIHKFKYPIRLEKNVNSWTHIDVYQPYGSEAKLVEFNG